MPKRRSKITKKLKELGDTRINDWDFMGLLNKDIKELEIADSLRRLGRIKVMEWDFRMVVPAVKRTASIEVDVIDCFKRAAAFKVMDWDFRQSFGHPSAPLESGTPREELRPVIARLENFLLYVTGELMAGPVRIGSVEIAPDVIRLTLLGEDADVRALIGREGHTASAIRGLMKSVAMAHGFHLLLSIQSHGSEMRIIAEKGARR
jgi:uncharacterized protein